MTTMKTRRTRSGVCLGVVALLALMAATACTGSKEETPAATTAATPPSTAATPAADDDEPIPDTPSPLDALPDDVQSLMDKPFTGDFDEMVKRRMIRVAVTFNRTHYFVDRGQERGITYEALKAFETDLNTELKTGNLKVHVVIVPMSRDQLYPALAERQRRHGRRHGDRQARVGETRRLLGADAHQRERGGGHRAGSAADQDRGRSGRPGSVRPQGEPLLRKPHPPERAAESARQAGGRDQRGPRRARRRRRARDGQRRPCADHRRERLSGGVLEPGLHRHHAASRRRPALRRPAGRRLPQGQSQAPGDGQPVDPEARQGRRLPERDRTQVSPEHQVREERRGRRRAQEVAWRSSSSSGSTGANTTSTTC